jgi:hypothetical protein
VKHCETGYLAESFSVTSLVQGIKFSADLEINDESIITTANLFNLDRVSHQIINLYQSL